ncbi:MAG: HRDC domain-containing protein [Paludibacter sp.]|nr:HRDC domain-containing protein [Paludibacter sp.]
MKVKTFHIRLTKEHLETDQEKVNNFLESVTVRKTETGLIEDETNYWSVLVFYDDLQKKDQLKTSNKVSYAVNTELTLEEKRMFETLKQWRVIKAKELRLPSFMIFNNAELVTVSKVKPQQVEDLLSIKGFGDQKITKFGKELLDIMHPMPVQA